MANGIFEQVINTLETCIDHIPNPEKTSIAICTYNMAINFYNIPKDLNNDPSLVIVGDIEEPFCPISKENLFLDLQENKEQARIQLF